MTEIDPVGHPVVPDWVRFQRPCEPDHHWSSHDRSERLSCDRQRQPAARPQSCSGRRQPDVGHCDACRPGGRYEPRRVWPKTSCAFARASSLAARPTRSRSTSPARRS